MPLECPPRANSRSRRLRVFDVGSEPSEEVVMSNSEVQAATLEGYVLGPDEGEHLVHWRDGGRIFIKIGSATRSDNLSLGTQQVPVGAGIPIHRHFRMDEAFY